MRTLTLLACLASTAAQAAEAGSAPERGRSAGCGLAATGSGSFTTASIRVLDRDRTYHLRVPATYDSGRAYPLVFRWHGRGGDGLSGGLGIEYSARNDAIVVGADGLNGTWSSGEDAEDLAFFDRMLEEIASRYCIDRNRVFSYGFSAGGFFTNLLACRRGEVLRASAAVAGGARGVECKGKVATWLLHDANDDAVPIAAGRAARDRALSANGCTVDAVDEGGGCARFQGCDAAPVVWCESRGFGHDIRGDFAPPRVWKFFQSLR